MNRRLIVYLVAFAAFLGPFTQTIYTPILPEITEQFKTTPFVVNLTISVFTFFLALMQMVYGPLADRRGRRRVILFGISLYIAACLGCYVSGTVEVLILFRALQAIGIAAGSVVAVTVIGDLFEGKDRGQAMGTFQMMVSLGPVLGPVIGGFLSGMFNFHSVFLALAAVGFIVLALNYSLLRETKPGTGAANNFSLRDFADVLRNRLGSSIIFLGFIQHYTFYNFLVFLPVILSERYGLTAEEKGLVFLPMSLCIVLGNYLGGKFQGKIDGKRVMVFTTFLLMLAVIYFLFAYPISLAWLISATVSFGLFLGLSLPVQTTLLAEAYLENRATAIGMYNFFRYMGMACGPIVGSMLYQYGGMMLLFAFIAAALLAYGLLLFRRILWRYPLL